MNQPNNDESNHQRIHPKEMKWFISHKIIQESIKQSVAISIHWLSDIYFTEFVFTHFFIMCVHLFCSLTSSHSLGRNWTLKVIKTFQLMRIVWELLLIFHWWKIELCFKNHYMFKILVTRYRVALNRKCKFKQN